MADNRLYVRCACGDEFYLARYRVLDWHPATAPAQLGVDFAAWLDRHSACDPKTATFGDWFTLTYEARTT